MNQGLVGLAFAAGLVAALNPCGFAMLPGYLVLVVRREGTGTASVPAAVGRAVLATLGMVLGFVTVFGAFAALSISAATAVQRYLPYVTAVVGLALVAIGGWLLSGRPVTLVAPGAARWAPTVRLGSMYGYGVSYAVASLSCTVAPFVAVTAAAVRRGSLLARVSVYLAYLAGLTLVVGVLAVAAAFASSALATRLRRVLPLVNRAGGALMVLVGLYVGYYGYYEVRLLRAHGNPADTVIAAAGRLQGALAGWVHRHGAAPWLLALVALMAGALATAGYLRERRAPKR
ncbi:cytochrome c biogenesis CcdA family protein [Mycobacterium sp.]|uniref:cytochrome c biogenesis CcdA family protein n=1 Tax=Mycobacterium sp. TaxID=1785 RepID=UPI00127DC3A8|nr:cytochrome c biogenesis CcdA family protein [Mycobacterium sp.]KAA8959872.1 MAG: cytochrome c biogenesis protein CcdA [Mycobacterium sp.]